MIPVHVDQLTRELAASLRAVMLMDVRGHHLQDRLQFTPAGRALLKPARAALATFDARVKVASQTCLAEIPRWQDKHAEYDGMFSEISCAEDEIEALRAALDAREAFAKSLVPRYQVWESSDSCGEFWSWEDVVLSDYDKAAPDKRRILYSAAATAS